METAKQLIGAIREFGIRKLFEAVTKVCWFLSPLVLWWKIYRLFPDSFTMSEVVYPGLVLFIVFSFIIVLQIIGAIRYEGKVAKKIEHAKEVFENPSDQRKEESFRRECSRFMVPYLYAGRVSSVGFPGFFAQGLQSISFLAGALLGTYASFSAFALIITNRSCIVQAFSWLLPLFPLLKDVIVFSSSNLDLLLVAILILRFFYDPMIRMLISRHLRGGRTALFISCLFELFHLHVRIAMLIGLAAASPYYLSKRERTLVFEPFVFPTTLHLVMQKAFHSVGRKPCYVSRFCHPIQSVGDIISLQKSIWQDKDLPLFVRVPANLADPEQALEYIRQCEPELHLGMVGNDCAILGEVYFDLGQKVRKAEFLFDKASLKKEFKLTAEKEMDQQRRVKLSLSLPDRIEKIIRKLDKEWKEDENE